MVITLEPKEKETSYLVCISTNETLSSGIKVIVLGYDVFAKITVYDSVAAKHSCFTNREHIGQDHGHTCASRSNSLWCV